MSFSERVQKNHENVILYFQRSTKLSTSSQKSHKIEVATDHNTIPGSEPVAVLLLD